MLQLYSTWWLYSILRMSTYAHVAINLSTLVMNCVFINHQLTNHTWVLATMIVHCRSKAAPKKCFTNETVRHNSIKQYLNCSIQKLAFTEGGSHAIFTSARQFHWNWAIYTSEIIRPNCLKLLGGYNTTFITTAPVRWAASAPRGVNLV
jgi:hypothetical protein